MLRVAESKVNLAFKLDSLTDTLMSGNKVRKLEYLLHDAISQGCTAVITCGGTIVCPGGCRVFDAFAAFVCVSLFVSFFSAYPFSLSPFLSPILPESPTSSRQGSSRTIAGRRWRRRVGPASSLTCCSDRPTAWNSAATCFSTPPSALTSAGAPPVRPADAITTLMCCVGIYSRIYVRCHAARSLACFLDCIALMALMLRLLYPRHRH